jgi:hypothetical protein
LRAAIVSAGGRGRDLAIVLKFVQAIHDNQVSGIHAIAQANAVAGGLRNGDRMDFHTVVAANGIDVGSLWTTLNGSGRHDGEIVLGINQQVHVDELIGEKSIVCIVKNRLAE